MYEESVDYLLRIVTPITDWVEVELLPPAEYYVDHYLPELDTNQKPSKCLMTYINYNCFVYKSVSIYIIHII